MGHTQHQRIPYTIITTTKRHIKGKATSLTDSVSQHIAKQSIIAFRGALHGSFNCSFNAEETWKIANKMVCVSNHNHMPLTCMQYLYFD